jgi:hypothetical protein
MESITIYVGFAIVGMFTGLGNAIGAYITNRYIVKRIEQIGESIRSKGEK